VKVLWLSEADVAALADTASVVPLVEEAFRALAEGRAHMPPKIYLSFPESGGDLRVMPAYLPGLSMAGVKVVNSHPGNPSKGLPTVAAVLVLNDPDTGMPLAVMAAGRLTALRTGAGGGVAAKALARPDAAVAGLVGVGRQALPQLEALVVSFNIREVKAAGASLGEAREFCRLAAPRFSAAFTPCASVQEACEADIIVTTTPSRRPVVLSDWVRPGTHINAVGADAPGKQELEPALLRRARVFVDLEEQAFHSGEVNVPLSKGDLKPENIAGNLGDVLAGKTPGRRTAEEITVFDSTGLAVQDVSVAVWVYQKALKEKKGRFLEL
jgi:alanine dehydrogenase